MKVAVTWEMCGYVDIEAETMEEAMEKFEDESDHIKLPENGDYVDGSFQLSSDDVEEMEAMAASVPKTIHDIFHLLNEGEYLIPFIIVDGIKKSLEYHAVAPIEGFSSFREILNHTVRRVKEHGGNDDDINLILGAKKASDEELKNMEYFTLLDDDYVIPGKIVLIPYSA